MSLAQKSSITVKFVSVIALAGALVGAGSAIRAQSETQTGYDAPRYPRWVINPSRAALLAQARIAVRQTAGRAPLGNMRSGETVYVRLSSSQDIDVWNAIRTAWAERGVTAKPLWDWDLLGMSKAKYLAQQRKNMLTGKDPWEEWKLFEPVYATFLPKAIQAQFADPITGHEETGGAAPDDNVPGFITYLKAHPEIKALYAWTGGVGIQKLILKRHWPEGLSRFKGNWNLETKTDLMNKMTSFPSDVWKMTDEEMVRPIAHVSEGWISDPEGTRMHWSQTASQAKLWDNYAGVGNQNPNHLNLYPQPAYATWPEGFIIRATANHDGFYPVLTVRGDQHGKIVAVEGGGKFGDLFRMMLANPVFKNAKFPTAPEPGYWYLAPDGYATNPKGLRDYSKLMDGNPGNVNTGERERAGVQHFGFSSPMPMTDRDPRDIAYAKAQGLPMTHTAHMHNYFLTVKWRLRDTGEVITVSNKGHPTIFQNPELRALASKYGNPDVIFSYDWVPEVPGVNAPNPNAFEKNPWATIVAQWKQMKAGTYKYLISDYNVTN